MKRKARRSKGKKSSKGSERLAEIITKDIWPTERDFFERPDRYRYVRRLVPSDGCVFCHSETLGVGFEGLCLHQGTTVMILMNKYPYNTGHLLILPRRHVGDIWDLTANELHEIADWTQKSMSILKKVMNCAGFNVGLNHGSVAGAGLPDHLHWHIVPRWAGDTNFFPLIAQTKALPETLEQTYNKLRDFF